LGSTVTYAARCIHEIKAIIAMEKAAFQEMKTLFTSKLDLNLRKKLVKYLGSFEIWCRKRIEEINPIEYVEYQEVLQRIKVGRKHTTYNTRKEG
jgi:hypothetical protein